MQTNLEEFLFEYQYLPSPDAEERMAQAWDLILALILEDFEKEQNDSTEEKND
jgi:hypothetical protein